MPRSMSSSPAFRTMRSTAICQNWCARRQTCCHLRTARRSQAHQKACKKRGITELVTPGVALSDTVLSSDCNNFLAAVHFGKGGLVGVAFLDISTGEFLAAEGNAQYADKVMASMAPKEVLVQRGLKPQLAEVSPSHIFLSRLEDWLFTHDAADEAPAQAVRHQLPQRASESTACMPPPLPPAPYCTISTLPATPARVTHNPHIAHRGRPLCAARPLHGAKSRTAGTARQRRQSLLDVIDRTVCPMGSRLLKRWLLFPLKDVKSINERLDIVEHFFREPDLREEIVERLHNVGDRTPGFQSWHANGFFLGK